MLTTLNSWGSGYCSSNSSRSTRSSKKKVQGLFLLLVMLCI